MQPEDYRIPENRTLPKSPESRAASNLHALRILAELTTSARRPTSDEADALANYVGWGAVPQIFAGLSTEWRKAQSELKAIITPEEYEHAKRSTVNAHYTSGLVVSAIWRAVQRLGASPNMKVLEPAVGTGNFFGLQPEALLPAQRYGIDKDTLTARIAQVLYPSTKILLQPFEQTAFPENFFDVAVGNVPFGDFGVSDSEFKNARYLTASIHNYFFAKALKLVRPGGMVVFISSRYTLDGYDKAHTNVRKYLESQADFLGAVRMPSSAFKECAGTEVVADIIFLRKRLPGAESVSDPAWIESDWVKEANAWGSHSYKSYSTNKYFQARRELILGREYTAHGMYNSETYQVDGQLTSEWLDEALATALGAATFLEYHGEDAAERTVAMVDLDSEAKVGAFFSEDGVLFRRTTRTQAIPLFLPLPATNRIVDQLAIRDALVALLAAERDNLDDATIAERRALLNQHYDAYVTQFGPLSSTFNQAALRGDPDAPLVLSLERDYDQKSGTAQKAAVLLQRVIEPVKTVEHCATAKEALIVSLNQSGKIDWPLMTNLTGFSEFQLQTELTGLVFPVPGSTPELWEVAEEYLSGPVRKKLREARGHALIDPRFNANVEALERVQPEDIPPSQIAAVLGVTWVPLETYSAFVKHLFGLSYAVEVHYVNGEYHLPKLRSHANKWATAKVEADRLVRDCLNQRRTTATYKDRDGEHVDHEATMAARQRQREINAYFEEWLFSDEDRAAKMTRAYNDQVNDLRLRTYDGSHLTLPGMSRAKLRNSDLEHYQKSAVWRGICQPNSYYIHPVGSGKTFSSIATVMELKRLGLVSRPMFVVPNATLSGWQMQFADLYPSARVLTLSERDLEKSRRLQVMSQIVAGHWDAVIIPHSSFQLIPVGPQLFTQHFEAEAQKLDDSIAEAEAMGIDSRFVKRLEKAKERLLKRLEDRQNNARKDQTVFWEQMAIDYLVIDEQQHYKHLGFSTKQHQIAGIDPDGNQRTFDLMMKLRYVQAHGRGALCLSGTPVTNTMGELYNIMVYLIPQVLERLGLSRFDEWSAAFGRIVEYFEPKPEGGGYQVKSRFGKFVNVPELSQLLRSFADVITPDMLNIPLPALATGERIASVNELSKSQQGYMKYLQERAELIREDPREALPDNLLAIYTAAKKMVLSPRMVMPGAKDEPGSRITTAVDMMVKKWKETADVKGTQLVFCDFGKPSSATGRAGYSAYDDIIAKLIERGVPAAEIAHIYQANNKHQRADIFRRMNEGSLRFLLGSTDKMGIGTNMQKRIVAVYHLTQPHRPADLDQREGRALRQGNDNAEVWIYYFITRGSLDELQFAALVRKARSFSQFLQGSSTVREIEDIDELPLSLEQFQAAASGDPRVRRKLEVDNLLLKMGALHASWKDERWRKRSLLNDIPFKLTRATKAIESHEAVLKQVLAHPDPKWIIGNRLAVKPTVLIEPIIQQMRAMNDSDFQPLGSVHGLPFALNNFHARIGDCHIYIRDVASLGIVNRTTNFLAPDNLEKMLNHYRAEIAQANKDHAELTVALQSTWPMQAEYDKLQKEQRALFLELGGGKGDAAATSDDVIVDASVEAADESIDDDEDEDTEVAS